MTASRTSFNKKPDFKWGSQISNGAARFLRGQPGFEGHSQVSEGAAWFLKETSRFRRTQPGF
jgi:hypothetical protein